MMKVKEIEVFTDGASWGNPGKAGIGVVMYDRNKKMIKKFGKFIGETTNNVAEYLALLCGLEEALNLGAEKIKINLDSELLVKQIQGEYRVKDPLLRSLFEKLAELLPKFKDIEIKNIPRGKNKEPDRVANQAIKEAMEKNLPPEKIYTCKERELF
ncbi:MAG: ribonuclease HI family protein [Candidatus Omnitrophica bacterium]|nr:ribonuclease HI family protein [Candidatus Omnitrophota bacterium]MCM8799071.1 ribonuclease HI family protein [Candidatus Omnitrophota bacterium]